MSGDLSDFGYTLKIIIKDRLHITQEVFAVLSNIPEEHLSTMMQKTSYSNRSRLQSQSVWEYLYRIIHTLTVCNPPVFTSRQEADELIEDWERNPFTQLGEQKKKLHEKLDVLFPDGKPIASSFAPKHHPLPPQIDFAQLHAISDNLLKASDIHRGATKELVKYLRNTIK